MFVARCFAVVVAWLPEVGWHGAAKTYASESRKAFIHAVYEGQVKMIDEPRPVMATSFKPQVDGWKDKYKHLVSDEAVAKPAIVARLLVCGGMSSIMKQGLKSTKEWDLKRSPRDNISPGKEAWLWTYLWMEHSYFELNTNKGV